MQHRLWMVPALALAGLLAGCSDHAQVTGPASPGGPLLLNGPTVSVSYPGSTNR